MVIVFIDSLSSLSYLKQPVEERVTNTLLFLNDSIPIEQVSTVEFEDGYICIYPRKYEHEELLYFTYLKKETFSDTGFNLRALIADDLSYYMSNRNIQKCFDLMVNNFSNHTIYFSCCEKEFAYPVEINGEEVELHEVTIKNGDETYNRVFWFYMGKDEVYPKVQKLE